MIATTELGSTGHQVTRIGLGMAALGRPGYINLGHDSDLSGHTGVAELETHAHTVLSAAYSMGVRHFDTARSYGDGEGFLGRWLTNQGIAESAVTVSSKWGYRYVANWRIDAEVHEVKEHTVSNLSAQYGETRSRLGDYIDVYQIHSATLDSGVLDNEEVLDRLAEIRADGLVVGLSTSGPNQADTIRKATSIQRDGVPLFGTVQSTWNLLEPSAGPALAEAHDAGVGTIIKESVANGRLTDRDPQSSAPLRQAFPGHSPDSVAIAAVLAQPWVDVVLSGASTADQLESNLAALTVDHSAVRDLDELAEQPAAYWAMRSSLEWT